MIIGDPTQFALEFELAEEHHGHWLNGTMTVWLGGRVVGLQGAPHSLRDLLFEIELHLSDRGNRCTSRFAALEAKEVFHLLNSVLYTGAPAEIEELAENETWARHELLSAATLRYKIFVVDTATAERVIHGRHDADAAELTVAIGYCDAVLVAAVVQLRKWYDEQGPAHQ